MTTYHGWLDQPRVPPRFCSASLIEEFPDIVIEALAHGEEAALGILSFV